MVKLLRQDRRTVVPLGWERSGPAVAPVALLKREHEMILDQLRMIETTVGPRARALAEPERHTLRELFRFFTRRVGVHFKREAVLITALGRIFRRERERHKQFESLLDEHRALRADAARIAKRLTGKTVSAATSDGADPFGIRLFLRRYRAHISCEERILFVLAEMRLTEEQKRWIGQRMLQV